jgi:hypothetical protein
MTGTILLGGNQRLRAGAMAKPSRGASAPPPNAYRYADITAARKQAKFHASIGVMLSISAFR